MHHLEDVTQRIEWVDQHDKINFVIDFLTRVPAGLVLIFVEIVMRFLPWGK